MYIFVFVLSEVSHRLSLDQWSSGPVMCGGSIVKKMIAAGVFVKRVKENNKDVKRTFVPFYLYLHLISPCGE